MSTNLETLLAEAQKRPDDIDKLFAALVNLPALADCVRALALYARSLAPGSKFFRDGDRYVLSSNFVALTPRYKRSSHVTIELRGNFKEFEELDGVRIQDARAGSYSKCEIRRPAQLAAVASYIRRAHALYARGAARVRSKPTTKEISVRP